MGKGYFCKGNFGAVPNSLETARESYRVFRVVEGTCQHNVLDVKETNGVLVPT